MKPSDHSVIGLDCSTTGAKSVFWCSIMMDVTDRQVAINSVVTVRATGGRGYATDKRPVP